MVQIRHILLLGLLAVAAGCSKTQVEGELTPDTEMEVTYQAISSPSKSKAYDGVMNSAAYSTKETFGSIAYLHDGLFEKDGQTYETYIDNQEVLFYTAKNLWTSRLTFYWPKRTAASDYYLSFYAYSPYDELNGSINCTAENGITIPSWDVNDHTTVDVMIADPAKNLYKNSVVTNFHHKLAQIAGFAVHTYDKYGNITFTVKKISLLGAVSEGSFDGTEWTVANNAAAHDYVWYDSSKSGAPEYKIFESESSVSVKANALPAQNNNDGSYLLVLPQQFSASAQKLQITYNLDNGTYNYDVTSTIDLTDIHTRMSKEWAINSRYIYNITLTLDRVYFAPSVADWSDETEGATLIAQ